MFRKTFVQFRVVALLALASAALLAGCTDRVTMPSAPEVTNSGQGGVDQPTRIKDPTLPVVALPR